MATSNCPAWATGVEPKTGAAMYEAPQACNWDVIEVVVEGCTVVVSRMILLVRGPDVVMEVIRFCRAASSLSFCDIRYLICFEVGDWHYRNEDYIA
jgi:hypothetical protein